MLKYVTIVTWMDPLMVSTRTMFLKSWFFSVSFMGRTRTTTFTFSSSAPSLALAPLGEAADTVMVSYMCYLYLITLDPIFTFIVSSPFPFCQSNQGCHVLRIWNVVCLRKQGSLNLSPLHSPGCRKQVEFPWDQQSVIHKIHYCIFWFLFEIRWFW